MAPNISILERYKALMGGEENLPKQRLPRQPKRETAPSHSESASSPFPDFETLSLTASEDSAHTPNLTGPSLALDDTEATQANTNTHPEPTGSTSVTPITKPIIKSPTNLKLDSNLGQVSPLGTSFCPIVAISKFPYKYISKAHSEAVADKFFNAGQFWERAWDLYYVWSADANPNKPLILVTEAQFRSLVAEINAAFPKHHVSVSSDNLEEGFVTEFDDHPSLRPRWLGKSHSRAEHDHFADNAPIFDMVGHSRPSEDDLRAFKQKVEAVLATKAKKAANKARKNEVRAIKQQDMTRQLLRAQRYLGLRSTTDDGGQGSSQQASGSSPTQQICSDKVVPFDLDSDVIFISVDIEALERNHSIITEVGVAILDTRDLKSAVPGRRANEWFEHIRAKHLRISEHAHHINTDFVNGCPDKFRFGSSKFVSLEEAPKVIEALFRHPFGRDISIYDDQVHSSDMKRNIVFVGHDAQNDTSYLRQLGYDPIELTNLIEVMDTALMHRALVRAPNNRSLGQVLYELEISGWNLHNAGNDAVYTMQAMLAMCVDAAERDDKSLAEQRKRELEIRIEAAKKLAEDRAREEAEGWSVDEDEGGAACSVEPDVGEGAAQAGARAVDKSGDVKIFKLNDGLHGKGILLTEGGEILDI